MRPVEDQGADSDVWIADNEWILRRARTDEVREWFGKEAALLPALTQLLPAAVPQFELLCLERGLVGYRIIRGEPLSDALLQWHPQKVGSELGGFIARLHSFRVTDAVALGVPVIAPGGLFPRDPPFRPGATAAEMGWREVFAHARGQITSAFAPYLSRGEVGALGVVFDAVLDDPNALDFVPTLVHTELNPEHTLLMLKADSWASLTGATHAFPILLLTSR